jgi:hypothetical protein
MSDTAARLAAILARNSGRHPREHAEANIYDVLAIVPAERLESTLRGIGADVGFLATIGATTVSHFRRVFDALSLVLDPTIARDLVQRFGVEAARREFVACAGDAVAVAAEEAQQILELSAGELLMLCNGNAEASAAVIEQLLAVHESRPPTLGGIRVASPLASIPVGVLVASNVRLSELGGMKLVYWQDVRDATSEQLQRLGWREVTLGGGRR